MYVAYAYGLQVGTPFNRLQKGVLCMDSRHSDHVANALYARINHQFGTNQDSDNWQNCQASAHNYVCAKINKLTK